jgi:hypothetical protein
MRAHTLLVVIIGLAACRSSSSPNNPNIDAPNGSGSADAPVQAVSISSIRMNQPTNGTAINLSNVVVVAHVSSKKYGHVYVQDAGGGQYTGIQLFCNYGGTHPNCSMTQAQIDALTIGEVVNVSGMFSSFLSSTAPAGAVPVLEIDAPVITAGSGTMTPATVDVDPATIADNQQGMTAAAPFFGTYVHVTGSSFKATSINPMEFAMTCTDMSTPPQTGATFGGFEATSGSTVLDVSLNFYKTVTYCLPCTGVAMPYPCTNAVTANQTFTGLSGIVEPNYNSNGKVYLAVSPTTDTDMP